MAGLADFVGNKQIAMEIAKTGILGILLTYMIYNSQNNLATKQDLSTLHSAHDDIFHEAKISNHFLWAQCVNSAQTNEERLRCVPPIDKVQKQEINLYSVPAIAQTKEKTLTGSNIDTKTFDETEYNNITVE